MNFKQLCYDILIVFLVISFATTLIFYFWSISYNETHKIEFEQSKRILISEKNKNEDIVLSAMQKKDVADNNNVASTYQINTETKDV